MGPLVQSAPGSGERPSVFYSRLYVPIELYVAPDLVLRTAALVDTGCESNLVRRGLIPEHYFHRPARAIKFVAANRTPVEGGQNEVCCQVMCDGVDQDTGLACPLDLSFVCLEADIGG